MRRRRRPAPGRGHPMRLQIHCSPRSAPLHKTPVPLPAALLPPPGRQLYHRQPAPLPRQFPSRSPPPGLLPETLPAGEAALPPPRPARSPPRSAGSAPEAAPPARRSPPGPPVPERPPHQSPAALRPIPPYPLRSERVRLPVPLSLPVSAPLRPPVLSGTVPALPFLPQTVLCRCNTHPIRQPAYSHRTEAVPIRRSPAPWKIQSGSSRPRSSDGRRQAVPSRP